MSGLRMSAATLRAIEAARAAARGLGHGRLASVHFLLALADASDVPGEVLREGPAARLRAAGAEVYDGPGADEVPAFEQGDEARDALEGALEEAEASGEVDVRPHHLFLAATADPQGSAARALERAGFDVESVRREVEARGADRTAG